MWNDIIQTILYFKQYLQYIGTMYHRSAIYGIQWKFGFWEEFALARAKILKNNIQYNNMVFCTFLKPREY